MKKLLSHTSTKDELAKYLAEQTIEYAEINGARAVVAYGRDCKGIKRDVLYLKSDQEEADTKIVLHALDATANGDKDPLSRQRCVHSCTEALSRALSKHGLCNWEG